MDDLTQILHILCPTTFGKGGLAYKTPFGGSIRVKRKVGKEGWGIRYPLAEIRVKKVRSQRECDYTKYF